MNLPRGLFFLLQIRLLQIISFLAMEVQIISRETIKPTTLQDHMPQNGQKTFKMSLLDMVSPQSYTPIIFFYSMRENDTHLNKEDIIARLKLSLSQTLANFPMLGGSIKGNFIHCSNEDNLGALFLEAKVNVSMAHFLKNPKLHLLPQFLPLPPISNEPLETTNQIGAQVSIFSCGGIAIGLSFFHKIIDGITMSSFIKAWAASNNEEISKKLVCGNYHLGSSLFPPREIPADYNLVSLKSPFVVAQGKSSTSRRFVFDGMAISNLKEMAKSLDVPNPTNVEAVTCFIWKHAMKASTSRSRSWDKKEVKEHGHQDSKWSSVLIHIVNIRRRMYPTLSDSEVGNIYWRSPAYYEASKSKSDTNLADLESILRQSLSEINNSFLQKVIRDDGWKTLSSSFEELNEFYEKSSESYLFTSWRNMGFNEVNFGWGKPVWNSFVAKAFDSIVRNSIVLMDTTVGVGIEAWVILDDETMSLLENDLEFLEFASPNPSIILP